MATSILNILNKAAAERGEAPAQVVDFAKVEQGLAASRPKPSARDIERSDQLELEQLEAAATSLFAPAGESWDDLARAHRERIAELSEAITAAKQEPLTNREVIKVKRAEAELSSLVRKCAIAEGRATASAKARAEFEQDGRLARLKELRKKDALRKKDPMAVIGQSPVVSPFRRIT